MAAYEKDAFDRTLTFETCRVEDNGIFFEYSLSTIDGQSFPPAHVWLSCSFAKSAEALAVHLGMSLIPYLWMESPARQILIRPRLPQIALPFWQEVYAGVLAEFFLTNHIVPFNPEIQLAHARAREGEPTPSTPINVDGDAVLVPMGAGKDSIVCFALLRECCPLSKLRWFYVGRNEGEFSACDRYRRIATQESQEPLVQEGIAYAPYEWKSGFVTVGHPFACFVLFSSVLQAAAHGYRYVCLGNERSANYDDVPGVNHQWDKSAHFLSLVCNYLPHFTNVEVFSAVQQWWELQIVALFCRMTSAAPYWSLFLSCNMPLEDEHWCGDCEKCLFIALCLLGFEEPSRVHSIWRGANVLQNAELLPKLSEMLGKKEKRPPFDCVGTEDEVALATSLAVRRYRNAARSQASDCQPRMPVLLRKCGATSWKSPSLSLLTETVKADVPKWFLPTIAQAELLLAEIADTL